MLVAFVYVGYFFLTMYSTLPSSEPEPYDGASDRSAEAVLSASFPRDGV